MFAKTARKPIVAGQLLVIRDNLLLAERPIEAARLETITLGGLAEKLKPGDNPITVSLTENNQLPYSLEVTYPAAEPDHSPKGILNISTKLSSEKAKQGQAVTLTMSVSNSSTETQPMPIAVLGIPAGLEASRNQLEALKMRGQVDAFEIDGRRIFCFWRSLGPKQTVELNVELKAAVSGRYTGPPSKIYLQSEPEQAGWADPVSMEILQK
jgi:hypothetical protein